MFLFFGILWFFDGHARYRKIKENHLRAEEGK